jgi:hypothetical protein
MVKVWRVSFRKMARFYGQFKDVLCIFTADLNEPTKKGRGVPTTLGYATVSDVTEMVVQKNMFTISR